MRDRGRHGGEAVKSGRRDAPRAGPSGDRGRRALHSRSMAKRDPRAVLGVEPSATPDADQGRLASPRADEPSRPDRRRSGRVARRDAADGRDQRRLRGADPRDRPGRRASGRGSDADGTPFEPGVARRRGGPPRPEADAAGHRPGRHERDVPAAEPGGRQRRAADHPAAASRRCAPTSSAASRRARRRRPARSSAIGSAISGGRRPPSLAAGRGDGHPVRQVPRPHARPDRGLRAVVHRLGGGDRQPRPGPRQRGARHPGRPRSPRGPPARPPDARARRPHRLTRIAGNARSPSDTGGRP